MKTHFILIEDDPQQLESIKLAIERHYPGVEVQTLETESDFYDHLAKIPIPDERLRMVICDVMLPWAFPSVDAPIPPADVIKETFRKAGLRCWKKFRQREDLRSVPWIYFTVLDEKTIGFQSHSDARTAHVPKANSSELPDDRTGYVQKANSIHPLLKKIDEFQALIDSRIPSA